MCASVLKNDNSLKTNCRRGKRKVKEKRISHKKISNEICAYEKSRLIFAAAVFLTVFIFLVKI
jgi:hypothetical protein